MKRNKKVVKSREDKRIEKQLIRTINKLIAENEKIMRENEFLEQEKELLLNHLKKLHLSGSIIAEQAAKINSDSSADPQKQIPLELNEASIELNIEEKAAVELSGESNFIE